MKKFSLTAIIILSVGLAMAIIGAVLSGITFGNGAKFDAAELARVLETIGYIAAALSGIVLVAIGVSYAITEQTKK